MGQKNHYNGTKLQGSHTSVAGGADKLLHALESEPWLVSVRPAEIKSARGGRGPKYLSVDRPREEDVRAHTLTLTVHTSASVQRIFLEVREGDFDQAIAAIREKMRRKMKGTPLRER